MHFARSINGVASLLRMKRRTTEREVVFPSREVLHPRVNMIMGAARFATNFILVVGVTSHTHFACVATECCPLGRGFSPSRTRPSPLARSYSTSRWTTASRAPRDRREAANLSDLVYDSLTIIAINHLSGPQTLCAKRLFKGQSKRERLFPTANAHVRLVAPTTVLGTVAPPRRKTNAQMRPREYSTEVEIERPH
jgi:hypothetical protein